MILKYNKRMGGVDLMDKGEKCYAITTRVKKWYWPICTWYLNISMVQAWRLYRAHMAERFRHEEEAQAEAQEKASFCERKEMELVWKKKRLAERKRLEIPLLEFTRQVVDSLFRKHSDPNKTIVPQNEAILPDSTLSEVRFDSGRHLCCKVSWTLTLLLQVPHP
jgi:hypothetical protein